MRHDHLDPHFVYRAQVPPLDHALPAPRGILRGPLAGGVPGVRRGVGEAGEPGGGFWDAEGGGVIDLKMNEWGTFKMKDGRVVKLKKVPGGWIAKTSFDGGPDGLSWDTPEEFVFDLYHEGFPT